MDLSKRAALHRAARNEHRDANLSALEVRTDSASGLLFVRGEASVVDSPYEVHDAYGSFEETIRAGAFDKTVSENPDVVLLTNHTGLALARTTTALGMPGGLKLGSTPNLTFEASMDPERSDAKDAALAVRSGAATQSSFAFRVMRDQWSEDYMTRDIFEVNLSKGDVSICNFGANPAAYAAMRSLGVQVSEFDEALEACRNGNADASQRALIQRAYGSIEKALRPTSVPQSIREDVAKLYAVGADIPNLRLQTKILEPLVSGEDDWHDDTAPESAAVEAAEDAPPMCPSCGVPLAGMTIGGGIGGGGGMQGLSYGEQNLLKRLMFKISGISILTGDEKTGSPISDLTTPMIPVDALQGDNHTIPTINSAAEDVNVTGAGHADFYKSDLIPTGGAKPLPQVAAPAGPIDYLNPTVQPIDGHTEGGLYKVDDVPTTFPADPPGKGIGTVTKDVGGLDYLNPTVKPTGSATDGGNYKVDLPAGTSGTSDLPPVDGGAYKTDIKPK